jgi:hypothetical protein
MFIVLMGQDIQDMAKFGSATRSSSSAWIADLRLLCRRPFEIEREQAGEGVVGGNVLGPAAGGGDGPVGRVTGVGELARS